MYGLGGFGINVGVKVFGNLPLYAKGLGWVVPALVGMLVGYMIEVFMGKNKEVESVELTAER